MACVPVREQGRRAVAVLREASRPQLNTLFTQTIRRAGWESRGSTFVQRERAVGKQKWYARAASSHHCKAAFGFAFVVWRTTSAQIHVKRPPSRPFKYVAC